MARKKSVSKRRRSTINFRGNKRSTSNSIQRAKRSSKRRKRNLPTRRKSPSARTTRARPPRRKSPSARTTRARPPRRDRPTARIPKRTKSAARAPAKSSSDRTKSVRKRRLSSKRGRVQKRAPTRRELSRQIAERDRIIKDLTQSQKRFEVRDYNERVEQGNEPFEIPRGAIIVDKDSGVFELPPIIEEFPDGEWDDFGWEDYFDDVGDEDADSYGEEAATK